VAESAVDARRRLLGPLALERWGAVAKDAGISLQFGGA
jgi:hypothetical protein